MGSRLKKIALSALVLVAVAGIGFFTFAPAIVEDGQNKTLTDPLKITDEARALTARLTIGDLHSDALLWGRDLRKRSTHGHVDLPRLREGNVAVQVFTTVTKSPSGLNYDHNSAAARDDITLLMIAEARPFRTWFNLTERALDQATRLSRAAEAAPEELEILRTSKNLQDVLAKRAGGEKIIGALLGAEGGHALSGDLANLGRLYDAGFRLIGLTHFFDNELGGSLHGEGDGKGLTDFGKQVVAEMLTHHMIIDLAHASPQTARDVLAIDGTKPIVSHTGIYSHCPVHRNFPDDLMQAIAAKGGIIGIGFWADVTCDASPAGVAGAIVAAINLVGVDHVALGSDYDGAVTVAFDSSQIAALTQALMDKGLDEATIAAVMGGNMMRFLAENLPQE